MVCLNQPHTQNWCSVILSVSLKRPCRFHFHSFGTTWSPCNREEAHGMKAHGGRERWSSEHSQPTGWVQPHKWAQVGPVEDPPCQPSELWGTINWSSCKSRIWGLAGYAAKATWNHILSNFKATKIVPVISKTLKVFHFLEFNSSLFLYMLSIGHLNFF